MHKRSQLLISLVLVWGSGITGARAADPQTWPPVQPGVWEMTSTRTLRNGEKRSSTSTARHCQDPTLLFRGYWGPGILEKAGCRYIARKLSETDFRIESECMVRKAGAAKSVISVTLEAPDAFRLEVRGKEGKREYSVMETGRRVGDCAPTP